MAKLYLVNNDTSVSVPGDIVRSSGQNYGVVPAIANTLNNCMGIIGCWKDSVLPSSPGIVIVEDLIEINCTIPVKPKDSLYLSDTVPGKATIIKPPIPIFLGIVVGFNNKEGQPKATICFSVNSSFSSSSEIKNKWITASSLNIDFNNGLHQTLRLNNGVNNLTGLLNPQDGTTYQLLLVQPATGAPGTITITPTAPAMCGPIAGTLSTTNNKRNILTLTYDATTNPATPYWMLCLTPEL